jgi:hypothetical protein
MNHVNKHARLQRLFRRRSRRALLIQLGALVGAIAVGSTLVVGGTATMSTLAGAQPTPPVKAVAAKKANRPDCDPGHRVKIISKKQTRIPKDRDEVNNRTGVTAKKTAHFEKKETVTWRVSGGVQGKFSTLIIAEVQAHVDVGFEKSRTITSGRKVEVDVRPHRRVIATRGISMLVVTGYIYRLDRLCRQKNVDDGFFRFTAPYGEYVDLKEVKL